MLGGIGSDGLSDEDVKRILREYKKIAVVGFSRSPKKPSHYVPKFFIYQGYEVIPVNPNVNSILGLRSYRSLEELNREVDIVNVFRPPEEVLEVARQVLRMEFKPRVFWMQEGIYNHEAVKLLKDNDVVVVWNRCMMKEHNRLLGSKPLAPLTKLK